MRAPSTIDLPQLSRVFPRLPSFSEKTHRSDGSFSSSISCSSDEDSLELTLSPRAHNDGSRRVDVPLLLLICLILCGAIFVSQLEYISSLAHANSQSLRPLVSQRSLELPPHDVDALVFVSLGPKAISPAFTWSVKSSIEVGGWGGPVYIVTDDMSSMRKIFANDGELFFLNDKIQVIEPQEHLIGFRKEDLTASVTYKARVTKCQLLRILPKELQHVLYIDADIMVGGSMDTFLVGLGDLWKHKKEMPMALFEDCKAFTAGFCSDCDTWNTGVMSLRRGSSDVCMDRWCDKLIELEGSDQEALDASISEGACQGIEPLNRQHLRMMKDIFVLFGFVNTKTFNHFTQLFRPHKLQRVHRWFYERMLGQSLQTLVPGRQQSDTGGRQDMKHSTLLPEREEDYL